MNRVIRFLNELGADDYLMVLGYVVFYLVAQGTVVWAVLEVLNG